MLNNEKQLKNILKKIINENYRRHLIKEQGGDAEVQDTGVEDTNIIQSTAQDADVESTQEARTDTTSNNNESNETATDQGKEIIFRFVQTGKNNKDDRVLNLNPGQMKIQFNPKNTTQNSNIALPLTQVPIPQNDTVSVINTDVVRPLEQARKQLNK